MRLILADITNEIGQLYDLQSTHLAPALGRLRSISRTLLTSFQFRLQTGGVIGRESDCKAAINDFTSFSSRIAKFAVMLDVAILYLAFCFKA